MKHMLMTDMDILPSLLGSLDQREMKTPSLDNDTQQTV